MNEENQRALNLQFRRNMATGLQREGQAWMNALALVDHTKYAELTGTSADCFFHDDRVPLFKTRVFEVEEKDAPTPK